MLKYIKHYAESIDGITIYPVISLLVFFIFFVAVLYHVKKMNKEKADEISRLPLEENTGNKEAHHFENFKHA